MAKLNTNKVIPENMEHPKSPKESMLGFDQK
jgi:hypothetical protein